MNQNQPISTFQPNYFQKLANAAAALVIVPNFFALIFVYLVDFSNPKAIAGFIRTVNIALILIGIIILSWSVLWHWTDLKKRKGAHPFANEKWWQAGFDLCRYLLAAVLLLYATGKLMGSQLQSSLLWQGQELGELNGYQLTWNFFGHSRFYNLFIAISQLTASILLLFRRTTLLGACILLPILANIVVINYSFKILGPLPLSLMLLYMCVFLIACSGKKLFALFISNKITPVVHHSAPVKWNNFIKITAAIVLLFYIIGFNYLKASKQAPPSVLDGAWYSVKAINYSDTANNYRNFANLFIEKNSASIRQPYGQNYYQAKLNAKTKIPELMFAPLDGTTSKLIKGKFSLINSDSLLIFGTQGTDSIQWIFKRKAK